MVRRSTDRHQQKRTVIAQTLSVILVALVGPVKGGATPTRRDTVPFTVQFGALEQNGKEGRADPGRRPSRRPGRKVPVQGG
jgi:hypothetical protein